MILLWNMSEPHSIKLEETLPLSELGYIIDNAIRNIPQKYPHVSIENYIIMPNHIHLLLSIDRSQSQPKSISHIISQFKGYTSKIINKSIWQQGFYDRIIRDPDEFGNVWDYIENNPFHLESDEYR